MEQNREPRNNPMHICQLVFDKRAKNIQWGKDSLFNNWSWKKLNIHMQKKMNLDTDLTLFTKFNSK